MPGMPGSTSTGLPSVYGANGAYAPYPSMPVYPPLTANTTTGFLPPVSVGAGFAPSNAFGQYGVAPVQPSGDVGLSLDTLPVASSNPFLSSGTALPQAEVISEAKPVETKPTAEDSEGEEKVEEEEEEPNEPEVDEKQMAYSTMEGVKILSQPPILKAELHEHQV